MEMQNSIKIPQPVKVRSPGLLPMLYTVRELSEELDIPHGTLRGWLLFGAPHHRDDCERVWINGRQFAAWVKSQQKNPTHRKLLSGEGYCLHCNEIIKIQDPRTIEVKGSLIHIKGDCPKCGCKIIRGDRNDRKS